MKNSSKKNKTSIKKVIIITAISLFIALSTIVAYLFFNNPINKAETRSDDQTPATQAIDYNPPTAEQKQAGEAKKTEKQTITSASFTTSVTANDTAGIVQIRNIINGAISNEGTCNLTMTSGNIVVTKSANTYALPSSSTCKGFDINRNELPAGNWQITLTVTIGSESATVSSEKLLE
ncbi:MAG: hypothetical protein WCP11_00390 [Candidatus Saccharibacteria bacterium]